jgi:hypothetical protein
MTPAQLDDILADYDRRWGPCRLPSLVSEATRAKYETVRQALDAGRAPWAADVAAIRAAMGRAWKAMEAEAVASGHQPLPPACVVVQGERGLYAFVFDDQHRQAVVLRYAHERQPITVWSASDVLALIDRPGITQDAMRLFPGSSVQPAQYRQGKRRAAFDAGTELDDILPMPGEAAE